MLRVCSTAIFRLVFVESHFRAVCFVIELLHFVLVESGCCDLFLVCSGLWVLFDELLGFAEFCSSELQRFCRFSRVWCIAASRLLCLQVQSEF